MKYMLVFQVVSKFLHAFTSHPQKESGTVNCHTIVHSCKLMRARAATSPTARGRLIANDSTENLKMHNVCLSPS